MSVLACNLQTAGLNDQQELRKAAFKQVYGWIISPALWAQSLTRRFWFQKLWARRPPLYYELEYYWERIPGCEKPYLATRYGDRSRERWIYHDFKTGPFSYTFNKSISSKSSVATLPDTKRLKLTPD